MSLRLRLFAIVIAAALLAVAPLAIVLLLQVRDGVYARTVADARARLQVAAATAASCSTPGCAELAAQSAGGRIIEGSCGARIGREGNVLRLCDDFRGGSSLEIRADLAAVREQLRALDVRLLITLAVFVAVLVVVAAALLERGIVRRLARVDAVLEEIGAEQGGPQLLPEGGDAVGRLGAAVNRLAERLREERARTRAQIEELRAARQAVQRSEQLASVGRLAAGVAHEVGNPVAALIGYAALLRGRVQQGKGVEDYAERIEREAVRIDRILRDLLDLARPPTELMSIDLARAVQLACSAVVPQHPALRVDPALSSVPPVVGEEHYVSQVFVNLLANAARAGASEVSIRGEAANGAVTVRVEDDGPGIPPSALPRLFEPFFTTAAPGQGTGLGLALCHATMERIGGSIAARNGGRGAVFELRFRVGSRRPGSPDGA